MVPPGEETSVQVPVGGRPVNVILPVVVPQEGWVTLAGTGGDGCRGSSTITTTAELTELHPPEFVTVKEWEPGFRPEIVVLVPEPLVALPPGKRFRIQLPEGRPVICTLPVFNEHVGCVIVPMAGDAGAVGGACMTTGDETCDVHPLECVTENE
jgi:hypothetical protein